MIGQTLAHYKIEEKLGEGGMGVVYRARDTHLDRPVAIKVLRSEALADAERKRRFVQEAKSASALNHPNIITIYDIGSADGVDFIAMEYVPGATLDHHIGRKGLSLADALKYAIQIADALARAHAAGIVHRDLKPANIMISEHGLVKVLDFGLAKLTETADSDPSAPTQTLEAAAPHTEEGSIVGTVAYMSPEQAEGKKVDARSDIFSFGSVLYEMLTGRRPFQGETKISTLSAILHKDPPPLLDLAPSAPREMERVLGLCLRKDFNRRFQHMDDVKIALEALKEESESGKLSLAAPRPAPRGHWAAFAIIVAAVVLLCLGLGVAWWLMRGSRPVSSPVLTRLTSDSGLTFQPALSPDGKLLAYASDRSGENNLDIWVQQVGGSQPIRLTRDLADETDPNFSPDGRSITFAGARGIYVVPALGGEPQLIAEGGHRPRFSPDGAEIAYWTGDGRFYGQIYLVSSSGGQPRRFQPDYTLARDPVWSPYGKRLLFRGGQRLEFDWWVAPLNGGSPLRAGVGSALTQRGLALLPAIPEAWSREGDFVFFSASLGDSTNVWRIPISPQSGRVTGPPQRVTSGTGLEAYASIGTDGRLVFSSLSSQVNIWSLPVDANAGKVTGELQRLTDGAAGDTRPAISLDGGKLAFLSARSGNLDVWVKDLASGKETDLTPTPLPEVRVRISPDGSDVFYAQRFSNPLLDIYTAPVQGGVPKKICSGCGPLLSASPDGNKIIYWPGGTPIRLLALDVKSGQKSEILPSTDYGRYRPLFSPDGRWLTFTAGIAANPSQVFVAPYRAGVPISERDWIAVTQSSGRMEEPDWSPDGNLIYYLSDQDGLLCIWAQRLDPATKHPIGRPWEIHHFDKARRSLNNLFLSDISLSVARDKLVFSLGERTGNIWMAESKE